MSAHHMLQPGKLIRGAKPLLLAATALFLVLIPTWASAVSTPLYVACRLTAGMTAADLEKIVFEEFDGTLVIKGMVWQGDAAWYAFANDEDDEDGDEDDEDGDDQDLGNPVGCDDDEEQVPFFSSAVQVTGVLLTQGTAADFLENPGILWLQYTFLGADGLPLGTAEGFVSLEEIEDLEGTASFQGTVRIDGQDLLFFGTGETRLSPFVYYRLYQERLAEIEAERARELAALDEEYAAAKAALEEEYADDPEGLAAALAALDAWYEARKASINSEFDEALADLQEEFLDREMVQRMGQTVLTAQKPGFAFEAAKNMSQLEKMYGRKMNRLEKAKTQRSRVIQKIRAR